MAYKNTRYDRESDELRHQYRQTGMITIMLILGAFTLLFLALGIVIV